jgi:hypothetical protein
VTNHKNITIIKRDIREEAPTKLAEPSKVETTGAVEPSVVDVVIFMMESDWVGMIVMTGIIRVSVEYNCEAPLEIGSSGEIDVKLPVRVVFGVTGVPEVVGVSTGVSTGAGVSLREVEV